MKNNSKNIINKKYVPNKKENKQYKIDKILKFWKFSNMLN